MSGSVNKCILIGRLGRDPEAKTFQNGGKIVNLRIATSERWRNKQSGEMDEKTEWHAVVVKGERLPDIAERYLQKGSSVYIEGQLQTRKYTDQSGQEKYATEIVVGPFKGELTLLGGRGDAEARDDAPRSSAGGNRGGGSRQQRTNQIAEQLDDDIPF